MVESPLLNAGIHDFNRSDLEKTFLQAFPSSNTRRSLIHGLNSYIEQLSKFNIEIEMWLDGSFTTNKLNPNDIDLVMFAAESDVNRLPPFEQQKLAALLDNRSVRTKFGCDVYFSPKENSNMRSYWRGWFGFDRDENAKGIARVMVN